MDFIDRGVARCGHYYKARASCGLYRQGCGTVRTLLKGVGHCVDFIDRVWVLGGFIDRSGAPCGLYR